jgi:hypothetical protein
MCCETGSIIDFNQGLRDSPAQSEIENKKLALLPAETAAPHLHKTQTITDQRLACYSNSTLSPFNTMSITKSIVAEREADSRSIKKRNSSSPSSLPVTPDQLALTSSESMEPAKKRVRWTTGLPSSPTLAGSMQATTPEASVSSAAGEMRECMEKMEHKIHQIARKELALLNQSKKLRQARSIMTSRYQKLNISLLQALRAEDPSAIVDAPTLPPVFSTGSSGNPPLIDLAE